ncbi:hypothetical protein, partial [Burkholderia sp. SIMBA_052]|uniref:hypothetical protein n=1 Tax=Burkholderia sp. SIMBA_052 TaxID=3085793 RepID=UPI00397C80C1
RENFSEEKESAHESRAVIHRRLDKHTQTVGKLETTVAISGQVEAQLRDQIAALGWSKTTLRSPRRSRNGSVSRR